MTWLFNRFFLFLARKREPGRTRAWHRQNFPGDGDFSSRILPDFAYACMMEPLPMPDAIPGPTALKSQRTLGALRESRVRWNKNG